MKIFANPKNNHNELQQDLDKIFDWSERWLIPLNGGKCKVLHLGKKNPALEYTIGNNTMQKTRTQTDLGVIISQDLKWEKHIAVITKRANKIMYLIRKAFVNLYVKLAREVFKTYVRPVLEYASPVWKPYYKKDIKLLETPQKRVTKIPKITRHQNYDDRCRKFKLPTLEERRNRLDLIVTYKIINEHYDVEELKSIFSHSAERGLRGHTRRLHKERVYTNHRAHFISNRVVNNWNNLTMSCVQAKNLIAFKRCLDGY